MAFCNQCGGPLKENAKFCPQCGAKVDGDLIDPAIRQEDAAPVQPAPQPQPAAEKKPVDFTVFNNMFWVLYIATGLLAFLLREVAFVYMMVSYNFMITLCVFDIIFACGFLAVGIVRKLAAAKEPAEEKKAHALRDNICLIVSVIVFIVCMLSSIGYMAM